MAGPPTVGIKLQGLIQIDTIKQKEIVAPVKEKKKQIILKTRNIFYAISVSDMNTGTTCMHYIYINIPQNITKYNLFLKYTLIYINVLGIKLFTIIHKRGENV